MPRKTFFSFHYAVDIHRACVVRNSTMTQEKRGFFDNSLWEEAKKKGDKAIQKLIDDGLNGTSVTVVLIGSDTSNRRWVNYEIEKSIELGSGLVGVRVHNIKDLSGHTASRGSNPLDGGTITFRDHSRRSASSYYKTYDYVSDDGYHNLGAWIDEAARLAGR